MDMKHICQWMKDKPNLKVCNEYGPTEVTVIGTRQWIDRATATPDSPVYIGKALPGYRVYILDEENKLLPFGVPGQVREEGEKGGSNCILFIVLAIIKKGLTTC